MGTAPRALSLISLAVTLALLGPTVGAGPSSASGAAEASAPAPPAQIASWEFLTRIAAQDPTAATRIEIEPLTRGGVGDPAADNVVALWNGGRHGVAIDALRRLEAAGAPIAVGVSWPAGGVHGGTRDGADVRIGAPRTGARLVDLDFHAGSGHVCSVVGWGSTSGSAQWTSNISTDRGATWREGYEWFTSSGLIAVDAAVVGDWLYIGYATGEDNAEMRLRRCRVSDGSVDVAYGYQVVIDTGGVPIEDVAVVTNAHDFDNRLYCICQRNDGRLRFVWSTAEGTDFTGILVPSSVWVAGGLSATWSNEYACEASLFISYASPDSTIHVVQRRSSDWVDLEVAGNVDTTATTSISVSGTNVICAYEARMPHGTGIAYCISYNCGTTWNSGNLAVPDDISTFGMFSPAVDARNGHGTAIVYQVEAGAADSLLYRYRTGFAPGPWSDPELVSDFDVYTGSDTALNLLSQGGAPFDLGAIYIEGGSHIPYFDHPGVDPATVPDAPAAASTVRLLPPSPNPFRTQTALRFELPAPAHARLELFDLLGRRVATLLDEEAEAGPHEVSLTDRGLPSGRYVYRLTAGAEVVSGQLIRIP